MKNVKSLILFLILFAGCVSSEKSLNKTEVGMLTPYGLLPETLNGRVKQIIEKNYIAKESGSTMVADRPLTVKDRDSIGWTNDFIASFNEDGLLTQCDEIDENGKVLNSVKTQIADKKITMAHNFLNDTLQNMNMLYYDSTGHLIKVVVKSPVDTVLNYVEIKDDDKGNLIGFVNYNSKNEPRFSYKFTYDDKGKRQGYQVFNSEGTKTFEQKYSYNDEGFMKKQVIIDKEGKESVSEYSYKYDDKGNWVECLGNEGNNNLLTKRTYEYYE